MRVFFTKSIELWRLKDESSKESYERLPNIKGYIAPVGNEDIMLTEGNPAQSYKLITDLSTDIKKTDKLIADCCDYIVTGIQDFRFGALTRRSIMLEKFNS